MAWFEISRALVQNVKGIRYAKIGQIDRAIGDFDEAIRLNPKYDTAFYNRGLAYAEKGQYDRALADFEEAIRLDRNNADYWSNRGSAYLMKGQHRRAIADYDEAIRLNPKHTQAIKNRAEVIAGKNELNRSGPPTPQPPAADQGHVGAQLAVGRMYHDSQSVPHNDAANPQDQSGGFLSVSLLRGVSEQMLIDAMGLSEQTPSNPSSFDSVMLKSVDELELSVRAAICLKNEDLACIGDLVQKTESELLDSPNFGRKAIDEIKETLAQMGLHLGMEVRDWPPKNAEEIATAKDLRSEKWDRLRNGVTPCNQRKVATVEDHTEEATVVVNRARGNGRFATIRKGNGSSITLSMVSWGLLRRGLMAPFASNPRTSAFGFLPRFEIAIYDGPTTLSLKPELTVLYTDQHAAHQGWESIIRDLTSMGLDIAGLASVGPQMADRKNEAWFAGVPPDRPL